MREDKSTGQDDDFELLAMFNQGSVEAFSRIVEKHSGPLINFLHRYTLERTASEDLAQEAFLRLYKAAPGQGRTAAALPGPKSPAWTPPLKPAANRQPPARALTPYTRRPSAPVKCPPLLRSSRTHSASPLY